MMAKSFCKSLVPRGLTVAGNARLNGVLTDTYDSLQNWLGGGCYRYIFLILTANFQS